MKDSDADKKSFNLALDSAAWRILVEELLSRLNGAKKKLVRDLALTDAERRGLVTYVAETEAAMVRIYEQADRTIPPWLQKELDYNG